MKLTNTNLTQELWSKAKRLIPGGNQLLSKKPEMIIDVTKDRNYPRNINSDIKVKWALGIPIIFNGNVIAVLEFYKSEVYEIPKFILFALIQNCVTLGLILTHSQ